mmetsp:Transcript_17538/g.25955  ORF Transcript_17538/g.25955 Transcript_17538/m.25955 type:complete len:121 (-) Transcript_17538:1257-1619(-)
MKMNYRFTFVALLIFATNLASWCNAFSPSQSASKLQRFTPTTFQSSATIRANGINGIGVLSVKKGKSGATDHDEKGRKKIDDPLELFILFMTPWRNPNSIFLYMLIILIVLGNMNATPPQ